MKIKTDDIEKNMSTVMGLSERIAMAISDTAIAMSEISRSVEQLTRMSARNADFVQMLDSELGKFKTD